MQLKKLITLLLITFLSTIGAALEQPDLLPADKAYRISGGYLDDNNIRVHWDIADEYYLYQNKFRFSSDTQGVELGSATYPEALTKKDPFFGDIGIYRKSVDIVIPVTRTDNSIDSLALKVRSQGCADIGICYPPHTQSLLIALTQMPDTPAPVDPLVVEEMEEAIQGTGTPTENSNLVSDLGVDTDDPFAELAALGNSLGMDDDGILAPEKAFQMTADVIDGNTLKLNWNIADATYLYQHKVKVEITDGNAKIGQFELPKAKIKHDSVKPDGTLGDVAVYYHNLDLQVPLLRSDNKATDITLKASYQGCADRGICYPPSKSIFKLNLPKVDQVASATQMPQVNQVAQAQSGTDAASANAATEQLSEQDQIAEFIASENAWFIIGSFFIIGLLLSFTPCVFPMIPILSGIIAGQGTNLSSKRAFTLSLVYVLAMAFTYTVAGVLAGLFGANIQAIFQNPWIIGSFAGIFVLLSLSMFGFFELQLPSALQSKLTNVSNDQKSGSLTGVAVMGLLSALIVGPCIAPPLAGALIYIGQTGDAVLGGMALFSMSMGMGAPLVAIGTSAGKLLPKAGGWMHAVKAVFGVMMLGVAIYLLERIMPPAVIMLLWGTLLIGSSMYVGALNQLPVEANGWARLRKGMGIAMLTYGILFYIGVAANGKDTLQPLRGLAIGGGATGAAAEEHVAFKRIKTVADLDRELAAAKAANIPVMLDFYADWCVYCIQMEKNTFPDPRVKGILNNMVLLQADVTDQDDADIALQKKMGITAPPAIIFWDQAGNSPRNLRLMGFMGPEDFAKHLGKVVK